MGEGFRADNAAGAEAIIFRRLRAGSLAREIFHERILICEAVRMRCFLYGNRRHGSDCAAGNFKVCHAAGDRRHNAVFVYRCDCRVFCLEGQCAFASRDCKICFEVKRCTDFNFFYAAVGECGYRGGDRFGNEYIPALKRRHFDAVICKDSLFADHLDGCADFNGILGGKAEFGCHIQADGHIVLSRLLLVSEGGECRIERFHVAVQRVAAEHDGNKALRVVHQHGTVEGKVNVRAAGAGFDLFQRRGRGGDHAHIDIQMRRRNIQLDALDRVVAVLFKDNLPLADENIPAVFAVRARNIRVRAFSVCLGIPLDPLAACRIKVVDRCFHALEEISLYTLENIARGVDMIG